jgi:hypothetical protein
LAGGYAVDRRKERPHPGAQLRITDLDGHRITAFVTNTTRGQLADLELRHRRCACADDRIRCAKDSGLASLPLHDFAQNQIWCAIVALAADLTAWMQTLALTGHPARRWEPKRLRLRLLSLPARHARTGRRRRLHLAATAPFTALALQALAALDRLTSAQRHRHQADRTVLVPTTGEPTGPWNRRPPERPRANRHTQMQSSRPRGIRTPTTTGMIMAVKDPS